MNKYIFYLYLNILNTIFCVYTIATILILWIVLCMSTNGIAPICLFALLITIKFLFLSVLFNIAKKNFPNSILNKVIKELKVNQNSRKSTLLLAFAYDAVIFLFLSLPLLKKETGFISLLFSPIFWEIFTFGGVCMFYIALFSIWKIQDKLRKN